VKPFSTTRNPPPSGACVADVVTPFGSLGGLHGDGDGESQGFAGRAARLLTASVQPEDQYGGGGQGGGHDR
jgi:hypothetical protein